MKFRILDKLGCGCHLASMTAKQVKRAIEHAPFRPFTVCLSDQRQFEIPHPDFIWVVPGGGVIGVATPEGIVELIDLAHVTSLRVNGASDA